MGSVVGFPDFEAEWLLVNHDPCLVWRGLGKYGDRATNQAFGEDTQKANRF
jgi:hypothetical protein